MNNASCQHRQPSVSTTTQPGGSHAHAQAARQNISSRHHPRENGEPESGNGWSDPSPFQGEVRWGQAGKYPSRSHQILSGNVPPLPIRWTKCPTQPVVSKRDFSPCANSHCRLCRTSSRSYGDLFRIINCYAIRELGYPNKDKE